MSFIFFILIKNIMSALSDAWDNFGSTTQPLYEEQSQPYYEQQQPQRRPSPPSPSQQQPSLSELITVSHNSHAYTMKMLKDEVNNLSESISNLSSSSDPSENNEWTFYQKLMLFFTIVIGTLTIFSIYHQTRFNNEQMNFLKKLQIGAIQVPDLISQIKN
jgi:hypothetical protein